MRLRALAPAKVNLALFVGALRGDRRHRVVTVYESVSLADVLEAQTLAPGSSDEVVCPGVRGANLATRALRALRARGWDGPPLRVRIEKRIPVAGGMAGGSADAAATLRLAMALAPGHGEELGEIAAALGADVPAQLLPGVALGTGAGEVVERFEPLAPHAYLVLPTRGALSTPAVFAQHDLVAAARPATELDALHGQLVRALRTGGQLEASLIVNDLEDAAVSLHPPCAAALAALRERGADAALVSGSGPTVVGVWWGGGAAARAAAARARLLARWPGATVAAPVGPADGAVTVI